VVVGGHGAGGGRDVDVALAVHAEPVADPLRGRDVRAPDDVELRVELEQKAPLVACRPHAKGALRAGFDVLQGHRLTRLGRHGDGERGHHPPLGVELLHPRVDVVQDVDEVFARSVRRI